MTTKKKSEPSKESTKDQTPLIPDGWKEVGLTGQGNIVYPVFSELTTDWSIFGYYNGRIPSGGKYGGFSHCFLVGDMEIRIPANKKLDDYLSTKKIGDPVGIGFEGYKPMKTKPGTFKDFRFFEPSA